MRDKQHQWARRRLAKQGVVGRICPRCGWPILPGQAWDADHIDRLYADGGGGRMVPSHSLCNRRHGGYAGNARKRARKAQRMAVITVWPALGVEVAPDRQRTWLARAAHAAGRVVVELRDPILGTTKVVDDICDAWQMWSVDQVGIDPASPSATLVQGLHDQGMPLKLADARAMAVAHGKFRDLLEADQLRVRGHEALDDAVRVAQERRLAGASAVERYGGVDLSPLVAAELAVWALDNDPDGTQPFIGW